MSDYNELKRLAEAAGSGQWGYDGSYVCPARTEDGTTYVESWRAVADCYQPENTKFIAAANPAAVLALIAENEALRKVANELRRFSSCEHLHHDKPDQHEADEPCKVLARIDAAMSKELKSE